MKSPRLKYWHNTGNAYLHEKLEWSDENAWLGEYGTWTVGVHLHDAQEFETHLPPGAGEIDFKGILELLPAKAIHVVDLHSKFTDAEVKLGINELRRIGF